MRIAIVGTGYVGLVTGVCFSEMGVHVTCIDKDQHKTDRLSQGIVPIYEPGLDDMVKRNMRGERLTFKSELIEVIDGVDIIFIAVGTPPDQKGNADLKDVFSVARTIGQTMNRYLLVVNKSTVPVGTAHQVKEIIQREQQKRGIEVGFDIASNPEFLKEGAAIKDFMSPDRVVVGVESEKAKELMTRLYRPFLLNNFRVIFMDIPSAEMTKYAANGMLATRISFMNEIANLCELVGADVNMVRKGIGSDSRIGNKFLYAGCGYGGSCFPKDVKALIMAAEDKGYNMQLLKSVESVNERQKTVLLNKLLNIYPDIKNKTVAIWGLSFKPETDDIREAPALILIEEMLRKGVTVRAYDPVAMKEAKNVFGNRIYYALDMYDTVLNADALIIVTEWKEFRLPAWGVIKKSMRHQVVLDGRNIYDGKEIEEAGFTYISIGRSSSHPMF